MQRDDRLPARRKQPGESLVNLAGRNLRQPLTEAVDPQPEMVGRELGQRLTSDDGVLVVVIALRPGQLNQQQRNKL